MRRAFTMLELMLAISMASLVGVGAFAVINMMNRGDATLEARSTQMRELATLHGLLQDSLGTLVMSDAERPSNNVGGESLDQDLETLMEFDETEDGEAIRPRMILRPDPSELAFAREAGHTAQTFEVVLRDGFASFNTPEGLTNEQVHALERGREAIRGVLELRPEGRAWALWWRPVDERGAPIRNDHESNRELSALRLCGGLTSCLWKAFYRGDRLTTYQATWSNDLPAYLEVEVATTAGLYANWVFEIGWTTAAETTAFEDEDALGGAAADGAAADGASGGAAGATTGGAEGGGSATSGGASESGN